MKIIPDSSIKRGSGAFKLRSKSESSSAEYSLLLLVIHSSSAKAPVCTFPRKSASGGDHYLSSGVAGWIVSQLQGNIMLLAFCIWGHTDVCFCSFLSLICSPPDMCHIPVISFFFLPYWAEPCGSAFILFKWSKQCLSAAPVSALQHAGTNQLCPEE